jgi:hypothetical protein
MLLVGFFGLGGALRLPRRTQPRGGDRAGKRIAT